MGKGRYPPEGIIGNYGDPLVVIIWKMGDDCCKAGTDVGIGHHGGRATTNDDGFVSL